jgi:hypothetical protein
MLLLLSPDGLDEDPKDLLLFRREICLLPLGEKNEQVGDPCPLELQVQDASSS